MLVLPSLLALTALTAAPQTSSAAPQEVRKELRGARLMIEDGALTRWRGRDEVPLDCTDPEGTGRVADLAADPSGLTFIAADGGLYVLGPFVDRLDRVRLRDGAPAGAPTSVHVDTRRRVWIATEETVGVIDPSFGWGRTLSADDLPGAAPFALEATDGGLRLHGADGTATYVPDNGPAPAMQTVSVDGVEIGRDARLGATYGDRMELSATGTGLGGATFRYRVDGHHVWRALDDVRALDGMDPGVRRVEVVAVDQDLNLSTPFTFEFDVALPGYYEKEFVLVTGALVALVVFALSLVVQRRATPPARRVGAGIATTAVVLVFGLQILAGLVPHAKGWPFVGYSMYTQSFDPEDPVHRATLVARNAKGHEREIPPWMLGYAIDDRWQVLGPIATGGPEVARDALERVRERYPRPDFDTLQVQSQRTRLTEDGPVPIAPLVLSHFELRPTGGNGR